MFKEVSSRFIVIAWIQQDLCIIATTPYTKEVVQMAAGIGILKKHIIHTPLLEHIKADDVTCPYQKLTAVAINHALKVKIQKGFWLYHKRGIFPFGLLPLLSASFGIISKFPIILLSLVQKIKLSPSQSTKMTAFNFNFFFHFTHNPYTR